MFWDVWEIRMEWYSSTSAYEPVAVPEPTSVAMLGGGLTMIGALLRKLRLEKFD